MGRLARTGPVVAVAVAAGAAATGCGTSASAPHGPATSGAPHGPATSAAAPAASGTSAAASPAVPGSRTMPSGLPSDPCALLRLASPGQVKHVAESAVAYQAMVNTGSDNSGCIASWDSGQQAVSVRFAVGETRDSTLQAIGGSMKPLVQQSSVPEGLGLTDRFAVTSGRVLILVSAPTSMTAKPGDLAPVLAGVLTAYVHEP